jgi:hypothetical protein
MVKGYERKILKISGCKCVMFEKTTVAFVIEKYILLLWNPKSDYLF